MWQEHIALDAMVLAGKPIVKGTRLSVEFVTDLLAKGWTEAQVVEAYPQLTPEAIRACLAYAHEALQDQKVYPVGS